MRRLEAMAEMGVGVARRLERQSEYAAAHAETDAVPDNLPHQHRLNEIARSFAHICRAVAVLTALEDRIDHGLPALPDHDRGRRLREEAAREKRATATDGIVRALEDGGVGGRRLIRLRVDLERLLDAEVLDPDRFLARPMSQLMARLWRDLGLELSDPEAALWTDAAPPPTLTPTQTPPPPAARGARPDLRPPRASPDRRPAARPAFPDAAPDGRRTPAPP